ncbi:hypothetical protein [Stenotrophomonas pavanii]|uniref:hypothetical protein n=1 Tax=Stenotrophomonas pavanii TaxID=487698 RepID=UPI00088AA6CA|nr:hypothetical protein [Stenotrophomonas pavanii]SDK32434.1 hypothetical protein SAMN04487784_1905 [Stenotrophomonas pavanii]
MQKLRSTILDYVPPLIAFIAAVAAVIGSPKWDSKASGLLKLTPFGWSVLAIGLLALVASILVTARNKSDQAKSKKTKEQIAAIGRSQLLKAINHTVHPISYSAIWQKHCATPESPLDLLSTDRRSILASLDLNSSSPYADGSFAEIKWHTMLQRAATEGAREITTTLQIYSAYLSPEVMESVTRLLYSDFLQFRLLRMHDIVLANTGRDPSGTVPFFWAAEDEGRNADYEEFWQVLAASMVLCGARSTSNGQPVFAHH